MGGLRRMSSAANACANMKVGPFYVGDVSASRERPVGSRHRPRVGQKSLFGTVPDQLASLGAIGTVGATILGAPVATELHAPCTAHAPEASAAEERAPGSGM